MIASLQTKPYALLCNEGQRLQSLGALISVKATSNQTGGVFNLFDVACPPGFATPLHIHYAEDVAVYVLEGALIFFWGSERKEALAGSYFYQPRGTPHGIRVEGNIPARILYMTIPAGFDCFMFEEELLETRSESEVVAARHKIEILGPLPG
jgi:quercetin dioxygenase-like cupin family protein